MKKKLFLGFCLTTITMLMTVSTAYAYTVDYVAGTTQYIESIDHNATTDGIAGMELTAYFTDNTSETAYWESTGGLINGAYGSDWALTASDGTSFNEYTLINSGSSAISYIRLDGFSGNTVFDAGTQNNTPNSAIGWPFSISDINNPYYDLITVTYVDDVALVGEAPVGDIFRYLNIDFTPGISDPGFGSNSILEFAIDTDTVVHTNVTVPEPITAMLLASGLFVLFVSRKKKSLNSQLIL